LAGAIFGGFNFLGIICFCLFPVSLFAEKFKRRVSAVHLALHGDLQIVSTGNRHADQRKSEGKKHFKIKKIKRPGFANSEKDTFIAVC
jgi:hypothetical protein